MEPSKRSVNPHAHVYLETFATVIECTPMSKKLPTAHLHFIADFLQYLK